MTSVGIRTVCFDPNVTCSAKVEPLLSDLNKSNGEMQIGL